MKDFYHIWMENCRGDYGLSTTVPIPLLLASDRQITLGVEFKYTDEDVAHGILHEYYRKDALGEEQAVLFKILTEIVSQYYALPLADCILNLSDSLRKEGGEILSMRHLLSGVSLCPENKSVAMNLVIDAIYIMHKGLMKDVDDHTRHLMFCRMDRGFQYFDLLAHTPDEQLVLAFLMVMSFKKKEDITKTTLFVQKTLPKLSISPSQKNNLITLINAPDEGAWSMS